MPQPQGINPSIGDPQASPNSPRQRTGARILKPALLRSPRPPTNRPIFNPKAHSAIASPPVPLRDIFALSHFIAPLQPKLYLSTYAKAPQHGSGVLVLIAWFRHTPHPR
jgi:hypothetical protein